MLTLVKRRATEETPVELTQFVGKGCRFMECVGAVTFLMGRLFIFLSKESGVSSVNNFGFVSPISSFAIPVNLLMVTCTVSAEMFVVY